MLLIVYLRPFALASAVLFLFSILPQKLDFNISQFAKISFIFAVIIIQMVSFFYISIFSGASINNIESFDYRIQETDYKSSLEVSYNTITFWKKI